MYAWPCTQPRRPLQGTGGMQNSDKLYLRMGMYGIVYRDANLNIIIYVEVNCISLFSNHCFLPHYYANIVMCVKSNVGLCVCVCVCFTLSLDITGPSFYWPLYALGLCSCVCVYVCVMDTGFVLRVLHKLERESQVSERQ